MSFTVLFYAFCFNSFGFLLQDWWNSTSFANYYRTWNVVVHDWLYYYMYRDFLWVGGYLQRIKKELQLNALPQFLLIHSMSLLSAVCSRCLRSVSNQQPCCLCLQYQQWSMSTFWQSALVSSILYSSASSCALEVRNHSNSVWMKMPINPQTIITFFVYNTFILPAVMFNFILHDQRKGPIWNIIMWTSLFLGHGVIICLYSQEWYAQQYCPIKEVTAAEFLYTVW